MARLTVLFTITLTKQLASVADNINIEAHGYMDKNSDGDDFLYDGNGNMVKDKDKGIDTIFYNYLNLPIKIVFDNNDSITYLYDAGGAKHMKKYYSNTAKDNSEFYVGSAIYHTDTSVGTPTLSQLKYMMTDEGRLSQQSDGDFAHEYMIKDHLGNTRVLFADYNNNDSIEQEEILQQAHYYPFGMAFTGFDLDTDTNKFLYNGKELQTDGGLGWYDYGARFYDPAIGRWHVVDPMAEDRSWVSPYNYVQNNPIMRIDPNGMLDDEYNYYEKEQRLEKVSDKGGDETQYVNFVDGEGNVQEQVSVSGDEVHVYDLSDGYAVTNFDAKLDENYNSKSGYEYSIKDFTERNEILKTGNNPVTKALLSTEASGMSGTVHKDEYWDKYGHTVGTLLQGRFYIEQSLGLLDPSASMPKRSSKFSLNITPTRSSGRNLGSTGRAGTQTGNSWSNFLKANKGKYTGKDWVKAATRDYYKSSFYNAK